MTPSSLPIPDDAEQQEHVLSQPHPPVVGAVERWEPSLLVVWCQIVTSFH